jgi:4-hydroxy-2-oxoglutarate aldolase
LRQATGYNSAKRNHSQASLIFEHAMLLHGIFPPITTPFYPDGNLCLRKLEHNVARYSKAPVAGIVVLGSTGEAILLNDAERREVLQCAREAVAPSKVLIAGVGSESALETLRLTEYAASLSYDVAMVRTPYFYRSQTSAEHVLAFYRFLGDRSPLPVLIYNYPQVTGYDIPVQVVSELAEHPNIIGIKESSGSLDKVRATVEATRNVKRPAKVTETFQALTPRMVHSHPNASAAKMQSGSPGDAATVTLAASSPAAPGQAGIRTREKEVGFQVLVGSAQTFYEALQAGAVGGILAFADPAPTAMYEVYAGWKDGNTKVAQEKQKRVAAAARVTGQLGPAGVKYACDLNGYYGGPVRLPLLPLTAEVKAQIEQLMVEIKC